MDPNACLQRIRDLLVEIGTVGTDDPVVTEELHHAMEDLHEWIESGGFEPDWTKHLESAGAFHFWCLVEYD